MAYFGAIAACSVGKRGHHRTTKNKERDMERENKGFHVSRRGILEGGTATAAVIAAGLSHCRSMTWRIT
jgi:hypothetical protein